MVNEIPSATGRESLTDPSAADLAATVLSPEAVTALRDAGLKDLLWLICDSHELLRARCEQLERERDEDRSHVAALYGLEAAERRVAELENEIKQLQNEGE